MLERERETLTIDRLRTELRAQYDLQKGGKPLKSKSSESAFLTSESRRGNSKRHGKPKKDRGTSDSDTRRGQGASSDKSSGGKPSSKSGGAKCRICKETGHK